MLFFDERILAERGCLVIGLLVAWRGVGCGERAVTEGGKAVSEAKLRRRCG